MTYRDDLEAATERADALQREVDELREQNSKLKADARPSESLELDRVTSASRSIRTIRATWRTDASDGRDAASRCA